MAVLAVAAAEEAVEVVMEAVSAAVDVALSVPLVADVPEREYLLIHGTALTLKSRAFSNT